MLTVSVFLLLNFRPDLHRWLTGFLQQGPETCQSFLPYSSYPELYRALICGVSLPAGQEKQLFLDTGLIHLMVVSGSHLVFLELLLFFLPRFVQLAALGAYCFLTGFQPPVMRAFFRRLIAKKAAHRLGFTSLQIEAVSVLSLLAVFPDWILSRSFLMSWMCGLALASPPLWPRHPILDLSIKSYIFMLPFCWMTPVTVFWNTLLAPLVGLLLFPACLLAVVLPPLHPFADELWRVFLQILKLGPQSVPGLSFTPSTLLWPVPVIVHLILLLGEIQWRRASAFSAS